MSPIIEYNGLTFEWHDAKFELVQNTRKIEFEEVCSVFFDDYAITVEDDYAIDEQRFITVGISNQLRLLSIVWTERDDFVSRIITAYEAPITHVRRYQNAKK